MSRIFRFLSLMLRISTFLKTSYSRTHLFFIILSFYSLPSIFSTVNFLQIHTKLTQHSSRIKENGRECVIFLAHLCHDRRFDFRFFQFFIIHSFLQFQNFSLFEKVYVIM